MSEIKDSMKTALNFYEEKLGTKHDTEKSRVDLVSASWLLGVGHVLRFGAKKYAAHNWRKGLGRSQVLGAALRHVLAYMAGEDLDQETGLPHLHHASCELMFASELHDTHPHLDDRYKAPDLKALKEKAIESMKHQRIEVGNSISPRENCCDLCGKPKSFHYRPGYDTTLYCNSDLLQKFKPSAQADLTAERNERNGTQ